MVDGRPRGTNQPISDEGGNGTAQSTPGLTGLDLASQLDAALVSKLAELGRTIDISLQNDHAKEAASKEVAALRAELADVREIESELRTVVAELEARVVTAEDDQGARDAEVDRLEAELQKLYNVLAGSGADAALTEATLRAQVLNPRP